MCFLVETTRLSLSGVAEGLSGLPCASGRSGAVALLACEAECFNVCMIPMPDLDTRHENAAARTARQRRDAADRARRWRDEQKAEMETLRARVAELEARVVELEPLGARVVELEGLVTHAEVDCLVVAGLARAIARAPGHRPEAPVAGSVVVASILDQCGKAGRSAGGDYSSCAHAAGVRIQAAVQRLAQRTRAA